MPATLTIEDFARQHEIEFSVEPAASNPNMLSDPDWTRTARHWLCTLRRGDASMQIPFSQGSAHTEPPTVRDILDCVASDASSVENEPDWLDWAESMGFEGAGALRAARSTHETIQRQAGELRQLLGDDAYETLLWKTERL